MDIGPAATVVTMSFANETHTSQLETPAFVKAAATSAQALLVDQSCSREVDGFLSRLATSTRIATADHVTVLARHEMAQEAFYAYVLRWLHSACPPTTTVMLMPLPLYATRLANVDTALVVESHNGVVVCTPVFEGLVVADMAAYWGDVGAHAPAERHTPSECWRHFARVLTAAMSISEADGACVEGGTQLIPRDEVPFAEEVGLHLERCRRRELGACLSTVLLYGDLATVVEARYSVGLLLSMFLPDSLITWC